MNVLLIVPQRNTQTILPAPDIGIAYIARAALDAGANVTVLDAHKENIGPSDLPIFLADKNFDLIGIKCLSVDFYNVSEYCKAIKEFNPNIITVLGGHHPTALPEYTMKSPHVDYLIIGEGEPGIFSMVKAFIQYNGRIPLQEIRKISCLVYRDEGVIKSNPIKLEENIDSFGFPAWEFFKIEEYPEMPGSGGKFLPIITSRGCPSRCTFCCSDTIHGRKVRLRSPEKVIEEMQWLIKNFDISRISIFDDNFVFHKEHAVQICKLYRECGIDKKLDIPQGIRIDNLDKDTVLSLAQAGCDYIGIGIESGEQKTLDYIKKGTTIIQIEEKINMIKQCTDISLMGFFIIGFPHETEADIVKTIDFSLRLNLDYAAFTIFTPFPGTELFNTMVQEGYFSIENFTWSDLSLDKAAFSHKHLSHKRLKQLQRRAYIKFYFRPSKIKFFFRILFKEASFMSYLRRFLSILKN